MPVCNEPVAQHCLRPAILRVRGDGEVGSAVAQGSEDLMDEQELDENL